MRVLSCHNYQEKHELGLGYCKVIILGNLNYKINLASFGGATGLQTCKKQSKTANMVILRVYEEIVWYVLVVTPTWKIFSG